MSNEDQEQAGDRVRRPRLTGKERDKVGSAMAELYGGGASIRAVAAEYGRSFGLTRALLLEAGVTLRPGKGRSRKPVGR